MNVFITGASGLLGRYLVPLFEQSTEVLITPSHSEFDITNPTPEIITGSEGIVINLAAFVNIAECEKDPYTAYKTNTKGVSWLLNIPSNWQVYHISTDYVYDGTIANSSETDLLNPWCVYGKSKAAGDMKLLSYCQPNIHIIRTSFKDIVWPYKKAFADVYTNADTVDVIAKMIYDFVLKYPPGGVYNIGTSTKTLYELARRNNPDIQKAYLSDMIIPTMRPILTMDLTKSMEILND